MIDFKSELNEEQYNVVANGDGYCLVLAGAGSGKTRTITYRVAYLLEKGIDPKNILLVTFTNKASKEMTQRVEFLMGGISKLSWSGTFHHIAYRLLKRHAKELGFTSKFTVLDSEDSRDVLKLCMKQEGIDRTAKRFPSVKVLQSLISYSRNAECTIANVLDERYKQWSDFEDQIVLICEVYTKRKFEADTMDFDDLLVLLRRLLVQSPSIRTAYAKQFRYILVDEYQDTNAIQASIVKLLASVHNNLLVVGDDAQSIYSFRAANIQNILQFEKEYHGAKIFRLETNYRSTQDILDVANNVIANNFRQYEKELKSVRDHAGKPEVHAFADTNEEATYIVEQILELNEEGVPLHEIAVLFRAAFHSQALEVELVKRNIPYDYRGGVRFFERKHIKDVLAFLRVFANSKDVIAWNRILTMHSGIGAVTAKKLIQTIQDIEQNTDLASLSVHLSSRAQFGWTVFLSIWEKMNTCDGSPTGLIKAVLDSKYTEYLEFQYEDARERLQDIEQLMLFAEQTTDLSFFLAEATMQENYAVASDKESNNTEDKIVLSTIHQAKGLEWEAVFILHLTAGQFPHERSVADPNGLEEERRLFYVAVTRAKNHLQLTYPLLASYNTMLSGPSLFLEELDRGLVESYGWDSTETTVFTDPSDDIEDVIYVSKDDEWKQNKRSFLKSIDEL